MSKNELIEKESISHKKHNISDIITIVFFMIFIFGVALVFLFKNEVQFSEQENRYLVTKPQLNFKSVISGEYKDKYEEYLSDQVVFRNECISLKSIVELILQKEEVNGVYFAKDDYLMTIDDSANYMDTRALKNYNYLSLFSKEYSKMIEGSLSIMLIPNKSVIFQDKLPKYVELADEKKIIDTIYNQCSFAKCIDVFDILMSHKDEYIYYKTDHHWTSLGAYYAYTAWCDQTKLEKNTYKDFKIEKVTDEFRGTLDSKVNISFDKDSIYTYEFLDDTIEYTLEYDGKEKVKNTLYNMEKLTQKDKYGIYLGGNHAVIEIKTNIKNGKSILILKDSFAHCYIPFMINQYENIYVIDLRYYNLSLKEYIKNKKNITDILVLYSLSELSEDGNVYKMIE